MKNSRRIVSVFIMIALSMIGLSAQTARQAARINTHEVSDILERLAQSSAKFRQSLNPVANRSGANERRAANEINSFQPDFEMATNQLIARFKRGSAGAADVRDVLQKASLINDSFGGRRFDAQEQNDWGSVRLDLDALANAYAITWQWREQTRPAANSGQSSREPDRALDQLRNDLSGTFKLDSSRSDNPRQIVDRATSNLANNERQGISVRLQTRLESPEMLAIGRRGSTVTIASSRAPQSTFVADGREHQEQLPSGRSAPLTATLRDDQLILSSAGSKDTDFSITFDPIESGRRLTVTRQIYSPQLTQPVVVKSVYDRISDVAQWDVNDGSRPVLTNPEPNDRDFIVRAGESLVAVLNTDLTTRQAKPGDRFAMTVHQLNQYAGAVIEGTIAGVDRGGRVSGRSQLSLNVETIRLRNGQTYNFAGVIESVRTPNGETVQVDNEGAVKEDTSQTTRTVERAGIGTAIGALIGAIAGGVKGAVIGGVIGAAGGAGSVYVQGKDDVELLSGTEITIRATGPGRD